MKESTVLILALIITGLITLYCSISVRVKNMSGTDPLGEIINGLKDFVSWGMHLFWVLIASLSIFFISYWIFIDV